jgi:SAM-dependent methyltransferase
MNTQEGQRALTPILGWLRRSPLSEPFAPYGRALNDHWTRQRAVRFYLRGTYGPFHSHSSLQGFEPLPRLRALEELALAACRGRILNAGAGAGRHSLILRDAGFEVVSVDVEPTLVDLMRRRGLDQVYHADIFTLDRGAFDTILFLQHTIGLVGTLQRLQELLVRLQRRLAPHGQILLDSTSPRTIASPLTYAGEGEAQLKYRSCRGKPFPWLSVDFSVLSICARAAGYHAELLGRGGYPADYLACLTPRLG